jgi:hypothetical protein
MAKDFDEGKLKILSAHKVGKDTGLRVEEYSYNEGIKKFRVASDHYVLMKGVTREVLGDLATAFQSVLKAVKK